MKIMAAPYITRKIQILMVISSWASVSRSRFMRFTVLAVLTQPTSLIPVVPPERRRFHSAVSLAFTTGEPAITITMMTIAL